LGILRVLVSGDFPKIDLVKSPPSLNLPYTPKADYSKLIIDINHSQEYRKCLFVVKENGVTVNAVFVFQCVCHQ